MRPFERLPLVGVVVPQADGREGVGVRAYVCVHDLACYQGVSRSPGHALVVVVVLLLAGLAHLVVALVWAQWVQWCQVGQGL